MISSATAPDRNDPGTVFMFVTRRLWTVWGPRFDLMLVFLWGLNNHKRNSLDNWRAPFSQ